MPAGKDRIVVEIADNFRRIEIDRRRLKKMLRCVCSRLGARDATISVAVVGDEAIRKINNQFRKQDSPTDVVSFDLSDKATAKMFEVVVNGQQAQQQARGRGHNAESELALYVVHGLLHNLGFDDATRQDAREMHKAEDEILQQFGYGRVYGS